MRRSDAIALLLLMLAGSAAAHGLHRSDGSFAFEDGLLTVVLEVDAGTEGEAARELVVRDAAGERIPGRIVSAEAVDGGDHLACVIEHVLPREARILALQLLPRESAAGRGRRLVLAERGGTRSFTLTSGGNVEIVRLARVAEITAELACHGHALVTDEDLLASIHAVLAVDGPRVRVDIVLPLGIVESFAALPRDEDEFLSVAEQDAAVAALRDLVLARLELRDGGVRVDPVTIRVNFLGLEGVLGRDASTPRRLALATARASVRIDFELPERGAPKASSDAELSWGFFHARLHSASLVIRSGDRCEIRTLTEASSTTRWSR